MSEKNPKNLNSDHSRRTLAELVEPHNHTADPLMTTIANTPPRVLNRAITEAQVQKFQLYNERAYQEEMRSLANEVWIPRINRAQGWVDEALVGQVMNEAQAIVLQDMIARSAHANTPPDAEVLDEWFETNNELALKSQKRVDEDISYLERVKADAERDSGFGEQLDIADSVAHETLYAADTAETLRSMRDRLSRFGRRVVATTSMVAAAGTAWMGMNQVMDDDAFFEDTRTKATAISAVAAGYTGLVLGGAVANNQLVSGSLARGAAKRAIKRPKR